jgi:methionyl-tRNA formyltransferase
MRILLLGSTVLSACVEASLPEVVGHIPSTRPAFPGKMNSPVVNEAVPHDIKLSVQYDRRLEDTRNAYNLHTGLLPDYGGTGILHHTIENGAHEQGLTFHAMTSQLDSGPILSKITYPVLPSDSVVELYRRLMAIAPLFVRSSLALLQLVDLSQVEGKKARLYKRADIENVDRYERDGAALSKYLRANDLMV